MNTDENESIAFCAYCHIGSLQPQRTTYAHWHDGQFVVMPGILAWHCDFCGETLYDDKILTRLTLLLGSESTLEDQQRWRATGLERSREADLGDRRRA